MKKSLLLAGAAVLALSTPALAQQATGLYVSAGVGANWLDSGSYNWDLELGPIDASGSGSTSYDVGPMGVVAVGYDFGMFRAEAELGLRTNDAGRTNLDVNSLTWGGGPQLCPGGWCDFANDVADDLADVTSGHMRTISVMANALVDFDLGAVTLYGGGGLGVANVERYINIAGVVDESSFDTVWAYQGIAGLAFNINPNLAITGEYRYFDSFETLNHSFADGAIEVSQSSFANHSALIGLRYTFGATPAAVVEEVVQARSYLVFFDFDSSALTADARSIVASAASDALSGGSPRLDVTGHTDRSGSDAYNQALSIRRATSVQNELIANGVPADIIVIRGAGERENLVPTADGVREPQNRRVEIVIN